LSSDTSDTAFADNPIDIKVEDAEYSGEVALPRRRAGLIAAMVVAAIAIISLGAWGTLRGRAQPPIAIAPPLMPTTPIIVKPVEAEVVKAPTPTPPEPAKPVEVSDVVPEREPDLELVKVKVKVNAPPPALAKKAPSPPKPAPSATVKPSVPAAPASTDDAPWDPTSPLPP
jgi:hypothetical protein